jgi:hypothetical protein
MLKEAGLMAVTAIGLVTKLEALLAGSGRPGLVGDAEGLVDVRMSEVLYRY